MAMASPTTFPSRLWTMVMNQGMLIKTLFLICTTILHMSLRGPLRGERSSRRGSQSYDNYSKLTKTLSYIYIPNHNPTLLQFRQSYGYGYGYDFQYTYTFTIHAMVMVMGGYRLWLWVIMVMIFEKVMVMIFERVWLYVRSFVYIYVNMIYM